MDEFGPSKRRFVNQVVGASFPQDEAGDGCWRPKFSTAALKYAEF